ncbi:MAG: pseudaminic acid synthase [Cyclobacteriaceae bacterium]
MELEDIKIAEVIIGSSYKPMVIAEMSGNHNQSLERGLEIIDAAANAGAHAVKLQTYTPDTMTIDHHGGLFTIDDPNSLWAGRNLYDLYKEAHTPWEWHKPLFDRAKKHGLVIFSTPFDITAVDFLEELGVSAYKIASFENTDLPLLTYVAKTKKPIIMSTGLATIADLAESVETLKANGCEDLILLKCTSSYPATPQDTNLLTIPHMSELFNCHVGLSDHTGGIGAAIGAVALGARVVEKHFTLNRADGGVDATFSIEPEELKSLVIESERVFQAMGKVTYGVLPIEHKSLRFKRSVYIIEDIKKGQSFTKENLRVIRPGDGVKPKYIDQLLGKIANRDISKGTPFSFDFV